jgi:hypothetical protein
LFWATSGLPGVTVGVEGLREIQKTDPATITNKAAAANAGVLTNRAKKGC